MQLDRELIVRGRELNRAAYPRSPHRERARELRAHGWSFGSIGKELGITPQRAHQLAKDVEFLPEVLEQSEAS